MPAGAPGSLLRNAVAAVPRRLRLRAFATVMVVTFAVASGDAQELVMSPQLANHLSHVQTGVYGGRIAAVPRFANRNLNSSTQSQERREELRVNTGAANVSIAYKLTTKTFVVDLELRRGRELHVRRSPTEDGGQRPIEFHQPSEGDLTVVVGAPAEQRTTAYPSLWHLMIEEPDLARDEIEPLLRLLHPGWSLATTARGIEEQMLKQAAGTREVDRKQWSQWVAQLGSDKFVDRETADRMLRELGRLAVPYLRNLDEDRLDAEQRQRVRAILRRFAEEDVEDTPDSAVDWISGDPDVWYALAARSSPLQRPIIRTQLAALLAEEVTLDAEADEAAFRRQLVKLREQIDRYRRRAP